METGWHHLLREPGLGLRLWAWGPQPSVPAFPAERLPIMITGIKYLDELDVLSRPQHLTHPSLLPGGLAGLGQEESTSPFRKKWEESISHCCHPFFLCHCRALCMGWLGSGVRRAGKCSPGRMEAATCKGRHFPSLSPAAPRVLWLEEGLPGSLALRARSRRMDSIWSEGQHALSCPEGYAGLSLLPGGCGPWKVPASLGEIPVPFSGEEACDFAKPRCPVCEMHPPMRWHHWPAGSPALVLLHLSGDDSFFAVNKGQGSRFYGWWKDSELKHFSKEPIKDCIFVLPACWSLCSGDLW